MIKENHVYEMCMPLSSLQSEPEMESNHLGWTNLTSDFPLPTHKTVGGFQNMSSTKNVILKDFPESCKWENCFCEMIKIFSYII